MEGFGLIIGHLIGDYIVQNDWMAANKTNKLPRTLEIKLLPGPEGKIHRGIYDYDPEDVRLWQDEKYKSRIGHIACTLHCLLYTLAVWACSFWWMPWWGLAICFAVHWPIDRFRLARLWMIHVAGQKAFATGPLSPWSVIVVDNTLHLITLFAIGLIVLQPWTH